jgi:hypothetical protein
MTLEIRPTFNTITTIRHLNDPRAPRAVGLNCITQLDSMCVNGGLLHGTAMDCKYESQREATSIHEMPCDRVYFWLDQVVVGGAGGSIFIASGSSDLACSAASATTAAFATSAACGESGASAIESNS